MESRVLPLSALLTVGLLTLAGCSAPPPSSTSPAAGNGPALTYFDHPGLGPILGDPAGRTLYVFTNDDPGKSNCYNQCATNWPPYNAMNCRTRRAT